MSNGNQNWELVEKETWPNIGQTPYTTSSFPESITERMKVPAGWMVRTAVLSIRSTPARDYSVAITFIPDQDHSWVIG